VALPFSDIDQTHNNELPSLKEDSPTQKAEAQDISVRKSYKWVIEARKLSRKLSQKLSEIVDACDKFCHRYAVNFQDLSAGGRRSLSSLSAIQTTFHELESLKNRLESMAMRCDDFKQNVSPVH
jgi:molybdopterin/thiamine biosynthesis adenylyltransferase